MNLLRSAAARLSGILLILLFLAACSHDYVKPAPAEKRMIRVVFTDDIAPIEDDMPMATYRVPDTHVIIAGHRTRGSATIMFGLLGFLAQDAMDSMKTRGKANGVRDDLDLNLVATAGRIAAEQINADPFSEIYSMNPNAAGPVLTVSSALVMSFVNKSDARPYLFLKATLTEPGSLDPVWENRYFISERAPHQFMGHDSWTDNGAEQLRPLIEDELRRAIRILLADVAHPYPRSENSLITVQTWFPYLQSRTQMVGFKLAEEDGYLVFLPRMRDGRLFQGINILDESVTRHHPAREEDDDFEELD